MFKNCSKCGQAKHETAFTRNSSKMDGHDSECKRCRYERENSVEGRATRRDRELRRKYGISLEDYLVMVARQGNACACCGCPEKRTNRFGEVLPLALDHDHRTGQVRGLLCHSCNSGIGALGDSIPSLYRAIVYLFRSLRHAPT